MTDIEAAAKIMPDATMYHYILRTESAFNGYLQHLVNNTSSGVITDMTGALWTAPAPKSAPAACASARFTAAPNPGRSPMCASTIQA